MGWLKHLKTWDYEFGTKEAIIWKYERNSILKYQTRVRPWISLLVKLEEGTRVRTRTLGEDMVSTQHSSYQIIKACYRQSPLDCKEIQPVHSKGDQSWVFFGRNDAKAETPVLWTPHAKSWLIGKDWCWEGLGAGGEGDDRGWDGWMASLTRWTWVWVNSGSWWWTGRPGALRFMESQRVGHDWATELNWTDRCWNSQYWKSKPNTLKGLNTIIK